MIEFGSIITPLHIVLTGVSFRTLDLAGREKLLKKAETPEKVAKQLIESGLASEVAVISTCNRFEIVTVGSESGGGIQKFFESLIDAKDIIRRDEVLYQHRNASAVRHLYRVSSSLDSMVIGEAQILGQVKTAYKRAVSDGVVGSYLHHLFQSAFNVAKRVRSNTDIGNHGVSVSYVAVRLAEQIFESLANVRVLLIGSGETGELAALHLRARGCQQIVVANRTVERAAELAARFGGTAISLEEIGTALNSVDIVIGSILIDHSILTKKIVNQRRADSPLFLIDLGVPRNFASDIAELDNVYLYNVDDLGKLADENLAVREAAAKDAEVVIEYGLLQFEKWRAKVATQPEILSVRSQIKAICEAEVRRIFGEAGVASEQCDRLEQILTTKLAHLFHEPTWGDDWDEKS